jgi:hypothetical protein
MKCLPAAAISTLLSVASAVAQEPSAEIFSRFRAEMMERLSRSAARTGITDYGTPLDADVSQAFGIPAGIRVIKAAEIVFRDEHHLTLTFSTNSTDILLTETKKAADGTLVLTAFHTDPTLILRGAASGLDASHLQVVPAGTETVSAFRQVLLTWDRRLPRMLETRTTK